METRCEEVWREISNFLEDEISPDLRGRMEQHFEGCKRCTSVLVGTRNVLRLVGDPAVFDLFARFNDRLSRRLDRKLGNGGPARR